MNLIRKNEIKHEANQLASKLRSEMGVSGLYPVSIHQIAKSKNIIAFFTPMTDSTSGVAVRTSDDPQTCRRFMMINSGKSLGHQRFTACHEFYHLLFQKEFNAIKEKTAIFRDDDENEFAADWFASYLILPTSSLEQKIPAHEHALDKITLGTILDIEQTYRCSRKTVLHRLKDMKLISSAFFDRYEANVMKSANEYGYPLDLYRQTDKTELIGDYNIKARQLFNEGRISQAMYFSLLEDIGVDLKNEIEDNGEE